ncbi:hypothetical protein PMIN01_06562 [Paraphaeosphaeria minitans]|uniref:Uncharacterized protein n=1 Tax=Paraphaeosphaeria minitans TaxID=565426 RepID=A0A9P6KQH9_9PLEO|nr:hypothetical protein PMIN01_06562 [Paraphaeosphaeria minitans]
MCSRQKFACGCVKMKQRCRGRVTVLYCGSRRVHRPCYAARFSESSRPERGSWKASRCSGRRLTEVVEDPHDVENLGTDDSSEARSVDGSSPRHWGLGALGPLHCTVQSAHETCVSPGPGVHGGGIGNSTYYLRGCTVYGSLVAPLSRVL